MKEFKKDPYSGRSREFRLNALGDCVNALKFETDSAVRQIREQVATTEPVPEDIGLTRLGMAGMCAQGILGKLDEVEAALGGVFYSLRSDFTDPPAR